MNAANEISKELAAYFNEIDTRRAVNHMLSSDDGSSWIDLSVRDFEAVSKPRKGSKKFDEYDKYASAWLYSKKVQKDYFDFMGAIWASAWNELVSNFAVNIKQPTKFKTIEEVWDDGWYRSFDLQQPNQYQDFWLYCEEMSEDQKNHTIRLSLSLGVEGDYSMEGLDNSPENWPKEDESGDSYFRSEISFGIEGTQVKISNLDPLRKEIEVYLRKEVFKA